MNTSPLRDLVTSRIDRRWDDFASEHPNLAAAIDRVRVIEQTVESLERDPRYLAAMRAADLDEAALARAAEAIERIEQLITLVLPR